MKIPNEVKVGGITYAVETVEFLCKGTDGFCAEIDYCDCKIRLTKSADAKMMRDFLHELVHALFDQCGYINHDEEMIDRLAAALHGVIVDNPALFEEP